MTQPGDLYIVPPPAVPTPDHIEVRIQVGQQSKVRLNSEPFRPTKTYSAVFQYSTNLDDYQDTTAAAADEIWTHLVSERALGAEITTHCAVWLDNVTHPVAAKGVVKLPKGHIDTALSDLEFVSAQTLEDHLNNLVLNLRTNAKY